MAVIKYNGHTIGLGTSTPNNMKYSDNLSVKDMLDKMGDVESLPDDGLMGAIDDSMENTMKYIDIKIADLVGSAPEKLDTINELAEALLENDDLLSLLVEAIENKANKTDLDNVSAAVSTKAESSDLNATNTSVANLNSLISALQTTVGNKITSNSVGSLAGLNIGSKGVYIYQENGKILIRQNVNSGGYSYSTVPRIGVSGTTLTILT